MVGWWASHGRHKRTRPNVRGRGGVYGANHRIKFGVTVVGATLGHIFIFGVVA